MEEKNSNFRKIYLKTRLTDLINLLHPLLKLADEVSWHKMEITFQILYSEQGRSLIPIRKIAGLLLLKVMFKESDKLQSTSRKPKFKYRIE